MDTEYRIEYIEGPWEGYYIIVIGDWEDQITQDETSTPSKLKKKQRHMQ